MKTLLNMLHGRYQLKYAVEYEDTDSSVIGSSYKCYRVSSAEFEDSDAFIISRSGELPITDHTSAWIREEAEETSGIPAVVKTSQLNVYFPVHAVETYAGTNINYIVEAYTYINGDKITLLSSVINRDMAVAYPGVKIVTGERFYEWLQLEIPDPWSICYGDEWAIFRRDVCGEPADINNTGSLIGVEIHPVDTADGIYYQKSTEYTGGMSSIVFNKTHSNTLKCLLDYVLSDSDGCHVTMTITYNDVYASLEEYLRETYMLTGDIKVKAILSLSEGENMLNLYFDDRLREYYQFFLRRYSVGLLPFTGWTDDNGDPAWREGMHFKGSFTIFCDDEPSITFTSDVLPLTREVYAFALVDKDNDEDIYIDLENIRDIKINNIDMTELNIVNKIDKQVVKINHAGSASSGISKPVFVRVTDSAEDLVLHPKVTESIAVNLQKYKSYTDMFTLRVADCDFQETGRIGTSVVFKIPASKITSPEGTYYILDDNKELVTLGNYTAVL